MQLPVERQLMDTMRTFGSKERNQAKLSYESLLLSELLLQQQRLLQPKHCMLAVRLGSLSPTCASSAAHQLVPLGPLLSW